MIFFREKQRITRPELILLGKKLMQWLQEVNEYNFELFSFRKTLPYDLGPLFSGPGNPQKGYISAFNQIRIEFTRRIYCFGALDYLVNSNKWN